MLRSRAASFPDIPAQYAKGASGRFKPKTFSQLYEESCRVAAGLRELGAARGDRVGLISDNRQEWLAASFGILALGAADVPRGCDITPQELTYILNFTECSIAFAENAKQIRKILDLRKELPALKTLIGFEPVERGLEEDAAAAGVTVLYYPALLAMGQKRETLNPGEIEKEMDKGAREDTASVIFTSGTTGEPKGVMLSHKNFLCQLPGFRLMVDAKPGEVWLSVLPVWHVYERELEYCALYFADGIAYSKPIGPVLMADFRAVKPQWMVAVPRIWEAIMDATYRNVRSQGGPQIRIFNFAVKFSMMYTYFHDMLFWLRPNFYGRIRPLESLVAFIPWLLMLPLRGLARVFIYKRVKASLGGRFKIGISGGGSLPPRVDRFFNALAIRLQEGYGLTETAPIVSVRQFRRARQGTIGQVHPGTQVKIIDREGKTLPPGRSGIICVKGGQVMQGYYKKPEATAAVIDKEGWFNTGDIGMLSRDNELKITGRAKDTIVLRGGENVEPVPIENKIRESDNIYQVAVVGQDQKYLAALIVPVQEALMSFAEENNIPIVDYDLLLQQPEINELIANDVSALVSPKAGFKPFERIFKFKLLAKPFEPGKELSSKGELLRHQIAVLHAKEIHGLFK